MARGTSDERRAELLHTLNGAEGPVTGSELSSMLGVSRQAIVNDIAILRASGQAIIGGPHGYRVGRVSGLIEVIHCNHQPERGREEWEILLDRGIAVLDVGVDHSVFGEIRAPVVVETRADIDRHAATITEAGEAPLSVITGGRHTHTVRAPNQDALDAAKRELSERGILDQPVQMAGGPGRSS
jgi:transcriptional regulator of NAD metabolism